MEQRSLYALEDAISTPDNTSTGIHRNDHIKVSPEPPRSHEASTALCGGPNGVVVHQYGIWDLALQHFLHSQAGSASPLQ
ncbi:unnamed protein product [Pleuronectes platessa]|uniref:Uncharacterized protein n=1 Tax=Pleuronectes platessa TaxID=8262 RepID=A0A9N7VGI5_PLEPL|nr:unnamed protein product [Pleuronectes platessa]